MNAVMHQEDCEDSWRSAGFRVLDKTCFLACCAMKGHSCWNETAKDPPPAIESIQLPTNALDMALVDLVTASDFDSDPDKRMKAFKLLKAGANMKTSL